MITENKKNELIDRMHDAIVDNDNVCDTAKDCADVAISFTTECCSKLNEIIGNAEAIYQEKCKAFEFEAMERRADIEDLEKENKSLENQLEERNVSISAVKFCSTLEMKLKARDLEIVALKDALFMRNQMIQTLDKDIAELKEGLHGIYNLCDNDNPTHEHIWRVANDLLH
jgi:hypothetical protein